MAKSKKQIKLKKNWGNFGPGCVLFTAKSIMTDLVDKGDAEWTDEKLKFVAATATPAAAPKKQ